VSRQQLIHRGELTGDPDHRAHRLGLGGRGDNTTEDMMRSASDLWRAVRWPLLVVAVAVLGIAVATVLDGTAAREWALTIGGPALTVLLPVGLIWLLVAVVRYLAQRRRGGTTSGS
jgi:hypothetical protein